RSLVLVAVVARLQDHGGPRAVRDDRDRDTGGTPGVLVRRMRDVDEARLLAGAVEIDGRACGGHRPCAPAGMTKAAERGRSAAADAQMLGKPAGSGVPIHFSDRAESDPFRRLTWT